MAGIIDGIITLNIEVTLLFPSVFDALNKFIPVESSWTFTNRNM